MLDDTHTARRGRTPTLFEKRDGRWRLARDANLLGLPTME